MHDERAPSDRRFRECRSRRTQCRDRRVSGPEGRQLVRNYHGVRDGPRARRCPAGDVRSRCHLRVRADVPLLQLPCRARNEGPELVARALGGSRPAPARPGGSARCRTPPVSHAPCICACTCTCTCARSYTCCFNRTPGTRAYRRVHVTRSRIHRSDGQLRLTVRCWPSATRASPSRRRVRRGPRWRLPPARSRGRGRAGRRGRSRRARRARRRGRAAPSRLRRRRGARE